VFGVFFLPKEIYLFTIYLLSCCSKAPFTSSDKSSSIHQQAATKLHDHIHFNGELAIFSGKITLHTTTRVHYIFCIFLYLYMSINEYNRSSKGKCLSYIW